MRKQPCPSPSRALMKQFFVGGNWKLNGNSALLKEFACNKNFLETVENACEAIEVVICPSFPYLICGKESFAGSSVSIGAQNCHSAPSGAFTGEVSIPMLKDISIEWVILGHSERRSIFGESNEMIAEKVKAALSSNLRVIFCIGESEIEREGGETEKVIEGQLEKSLPFLKELNGVDCGRLVIAYEPVWAIGTGKVATPHQAQLTHHHIRKFLSSRLSPEQASNFRIIYGGSVTSGSAAELAKQDDIDGFLVGGASLKVEEFTKIIKSI